MFRTQVYLEENINDLVNEIVFVSGKSKSSIIREGIAKYAKELSKHYKNHTLKEAFGSWRSNDFNLKEIRNEWDKK